MGILFDIDDTLINHTLAELKAGEEFGHIYKKHIPNYSSNRFSNIWQEISRKYIGQFLDKKISFKKQRILRIKNTFQNFNLSDQEAFGIFETYLHLYENNWVLYPDVLPFLERCRLRNIPIAVISDGSQKQQEQKLQSTGIIKYFNFVITAESEQLKKPEKEFFLRAVQKLNSKSKTVFYIGDNLRKDAEGATNAGLCGIWLNRDGKIGTFDFTVKDLNEISLDGI